MRFGHLLILCAFVALSLLNGIVSSRGVVLRRQGGVSASATESTNSPSTAAVSQKPTGASVTSSISSTTSSAANKGAGTQGTAEATNTSGPVPTIASSIDGSNSTTVSPNDQVYQGGLPIKPKVTPGIAVAGVILMLSGIPYCLVGIKIKLLHIYLSTFFLSGLGVTVLIIYVMNPPVVDAIQGAYVTAVVITGLLTGGLAVVFPEVTEVLGCLLGGFCVSMWFLVLKPGGLVSSVYGKLVVVAVFCFLTFSLAFHHVTRPYALIFSLSFSGATATVLGIDCFSRAGLKEFWIYIWALNNNIFPLGTNNYPHTRGIRVEIAVIILITLFGVMSQVKLWKILKERRDAKDAEKRQQVADLEALDEDVGRRVEEGHKEERAQWEMAYGGKSAEEPMVGERLNTGNMSRADSGIGDEDFRKKSEEARSGEAEEFVETEEMRREREEHIQAIESRKQSLEVPGQRSAGQGDYIKRMVISVGIDEIQEIESTGAGNEGGALDPGSVSGRQSTEPRTWGTNQPATPVPEVATEKPGVTLAPEVKPLPVPIPMEGEEEEEEEEEEDISSLATWAEESTRSYMQEDQELVEVIITPALVKTDDDDRASSVAATLDEDDDALGARADLFAINEASEGSTSSLSDDDSATPAGSLLRVPTNLEDRESALEKKGAHSHPVLDLKTSESSKDSVLSSLDKGIFTENHSKTTSTDQTTPAPTPPPPPPVAEPSPKALRFPDNLAPSSYPKQVTPAPSTGNPQLAAKCSRVVKNYRTNEWAKHLADAERPELDVLEEPPQAFINMPAEASVPVHVKELQETSGVPSLPPSRSASRMSHSEPFFPALATSNSFPTTNPTTGRQVLRASSGSMVPQDERSSSTSPVERCVSPTVPSRQTPSPLPQNTLMGKRESIVRSRQNFTPLPEYGGPLSPPENNGLVRARSPSMGLINHPFMNQARLPTPHPAQLPTSDLSNSSSHQYRASILNDDMPLSDRRHKLLHSSSQNALNQGRRGFTPVQQPVDKREAMLKLWRQSIKTELQSNSHAIHASSERKGDIPTERRQQVLAERQKNVMEVLEEDITDERMRQKDMLKLHKEALSKMQAGANKHI